MNAPSLPAMPKVVRSEFVRGRGVPARLRTSKLICSTATVAIWALRVGSVVLGSVIAVGLLIDVRSTKELRISLLRLTGPFSGAVNCTPTVTWLLAGNTPPTAVGTKRTSPVAGS